MAQVGYISYYKPPKTSALAQAAVNKDPYGLASGAATTSPLGIGSSTGFAAPAKPAPSPAPAYKPETFINPPAQAAAQPYLLPAGSAGGVVNTAPTDPNSYDLNTDPAVVQTNALEGMNDTQAQAAALKQEQDLLLAYGDPSVAAAVLGSDDPIVTAAGQNPTSTVAQLGQQRDQNLKTLDDQLNAANLGYSGYRITQEQQADEDFQNALATAAAGLNTNLDNVQGSLASALAGDNNQRAAAISAAQTNADNTSTTTGTDPGATGGSSTPSSLLAMAAAAGVIPTGDNGPGVNPGTPTPGSTPNAVSQTTDPVTAAIIAASRARQLQRLTGSLG